MINLAIFASGNGSNFAVIAALIKNRKLNANLKLLVCDNPKAYVLTRAKKLKVRTLISQDENTIVTQLKKEKISLIVLAGYMRLLSKHFVSNFKNKIINIHPALLPAFKGTNSIQRAFDYGAKITGVTIHFVDEKMDHGPIILQQAISIEKRMSLKKLEAKIHQLEHKLYPQAIRLFTQKRLKLSGRKVIIG